MKLVSSGKCFLTAIGALATFVGLALPAYATNTVACDTTCDAGQSLASYADGNTATCNCVSEGVMDATVPDPAVAEGVSNPDTE